MTVSTIVRVVRSTQHDRNKGVDEYGAFIQRSQEMGGVITVLGPSLVTASGAVGLVAASICTVVCSTQHTWANEGSLDYGICIQRSQQMGGNIMITGPASERALPEV